MFQKQKKLAGIGTNYYYLFKGEIPENNLRRTFL